MPHHHLHYISALRELITRYSQPAQDMPTPNKCPLCRADKQVRLEHPYLDCCASCPWQVFMGTKCHKYRLLHMHLTADQWAALRLEQCQQWIDAYERNETNAQ